MTLSVQNEKPSMEKMIHYTFNPVNASIATAIKSLIEGKNIYESAAGVGKDLQEIYTFYPKYIYESAAGVGKDLQEIFTFYPKYFKKNLHKTVHCMDKNPLKCLEVFSPLAQQIRGLDSLLNHA